MIIKLNYVSNFIIQFYSLLWILIMWLPFFISNSLYNFNQLTWWSWLLQAIFYTNMFGKTSIICLPMRRSLGKCNRWSLCRNRIHQLPVHNTTQNTNKRYYIDFLFLGIVSGITWFVFLMFVFVLFHNPSFVYDKATNSSLPSTVQLGNVIVHYYPVTMFFIWTVFNLKHIQKTVNISKKSNWVFCIIWLSVVFLYLAFWKFNFHDLFKYYLIEDVLPSIIAMFFFLIAFIVILANSMYVWALQSGSTA